MLVRLEVENFRSFNKKVVFHMIQRKTKRFSDHVYNYNEGFGVLKATGIYGGNASGKTNLFKALSFIKSIVSNNDFLDTLEGATLLSPFRLNETSLTADSSFEVSFISKEILYTYELKVNRKQNRVVFEKLTKINDEVETDVFERRTDEHNKVSIKFPSTSIYSEASNQIATILMQANATLLGSGVLSDQDILNAKDWFQNKVKFLFPVYEFIDIAFILSLKEEYLNLANRIVKFSNTGVSGLKLERIPIDVYLGTEKQDQIQHIANILEDKEYHSFKDSEKNACTAIKDEDGIIVVLKLTTIHLDNNGNGVDFDLTQESRGTVALLHLLPAFILSYGEGVNYFIDEIDTSLHPILLKEILSQYLQYNVGKATGQLIFNTHESFLMDEKMMRQDELWLVEQNKNGESEIFPLSDFENVRFDLNLRKNYLNGKFGGVPFETKPEELIFDVSD